MSQDPNHQENILNILQDFRGIEPLQQLFWTELNYDRQNDGLPRGDWGDTARNALTEDPVLLATGGTDDAFHVIYARLNSDRLLLTARTSCHIPSPAETILTPYSFSVTKNKPTGTLSMSNTTRRTPRNAAYSVVSQSVRHEKLRTASERIAMLDLEFINPNSGRTLSPLRNSGRS